MRKFLLSLSTSILLLISTLSGYGQNWTVNSDGFQHNMTIVGSVSIDKVLSTDVNDQLAAFVDGECRGVANVMYDELSSKYLVFIIIYSNIEGEKINFKLYDASTKTPYSPQTNLTFLSNVNYGTADDPFIIQNTVIENHAPVFISPDIISVTEKNTFATTLSTQDADNDVVSYSIVSGADKDKFELKANKLQFVSIPAFSDPGDADANNEYLVGVQANDGKGGVAIQNISINILAKTNVPDWTYIPDITDLSMQIIAKVVVDGQIINNTNSMVAAYINNQCKGSAYIVFDSQTNTYLAKLTVYNLIENAKIDFKLFNSLTGKTIDLSTTSKFTSNQQVGSASSPFLLALFASTDVVLSRSTGSGSVDKPFNVKVAFSNAVSGFEISDITVINGLASNFNKVSDVEYTVDITPSVKSDVVISVAAKVVTDNYGNNNNASNLLVVSYLPTSISSQFDKGLTVYPNPSNGVYTVQLKEDGSKYLIEVRNLNGQLVYKKTTQVTERLDFTGKRGNYIVTIKKQGLQQSYPLMIY